MAIKSSLNPENINKGFIIDTNDDLLPKIVPATDGYSGIVDHKELLYIFALDTMYKFQCEDFEVNFDETRKFTSVVFTIGSMKRNPWFKNYHEKLFINNQEMFYSQFLTTLEAEIQAYYSKSAKPLVSDLMKELSKIKDLRQSYLS